MPDIPLHPALVHFPIGLSAAVPLVAVGIWIAYRRGRLPRAAFAILTGLQLLLAASGLAAMLAGHHEEDRVEKVVGRRPVHEHEERGEAFVWTASAVAALGIALLLVPGRAVDAVAALMVAGALAVAVLAFLTGKAGGEIVYRHGGAAAYAAPPGPAAPTGGERGGHDDDD